MAGPSGQRTPALESYRGALAAERRRRARRAVGYSAAGHVLVLGALALAPTPRSPVSLPGVVTVDLIAPSALPGGVPPPPRAQSAPPKPRPAPEAPTPAPPKRAVVLPEQPRREPKPKPKPKPKVEPKPRAEPPPPEPPRPQPKREPPPPEPAPDAAPEYDDLLAQLRQELGEEPPEAIDRSAGPSAQAGAAPAGQATGQPVSPEVADWIRRTRLHVGRAWVVPLGFQDAGLQVEIDVELDAAGNVVGEPRITRRSGNPWYDEGVVRAIEKASPLPRPPDAGQWPFVFRPEDLD